VARIKRRAVVVLSVSAAITVIAGASALWFRSHASDVDRRGAANGNPEHAPSSGPSATQAKPGLASPQSTGNQGVLLDRLLRLKEETTKRKSAERTSDHWNSEEYALRVARESPEESVRNLMMDSYMLGAPGLVDNVHTDRYFELISQEPRVRKLLDIATGGTSEQRKALLDSVIGMCRIYLEELPDFGTEGTPWKPTVLHPGAGIAYPYLLRYLDNNATTLELIVRMGRRLQAAARKRFGEDDSGRRMGSEQGMIMGYACDHFLTLVLNREDLRSRITSAQSEVLEAFKTYREPRSGKERNWFQEQWEILDFAERFVEAEEDRKEG